jgi:hypothetical protein
MKTARFVFLMNACVALLCRTGYADRAAGDEKQYHGRGQPPRKAERSQLGEPAKPTIRKQLPNGRRPFAAVRNPRQGFDGSFPAARNGLIENAPTGGTRPVRPPGPVRAAALPLSKMRHRSPNPPVITGSANLSRNTGAIDGTQLHRRL